VAKFRNITGDALAVYKPAEVRGARIVDADAVIEVDGDVVSQDGDAYTVGEGDNARLWPKALWELVDNKAVSKASNVKEA
jgi:hypothetical protein